MKTIAQATKNPHVEDVLPKVSNIIPFPFVPKDKTAPVALPVGTSVSAEEIGLMTVRGPSLNNLGIYDGDHLIVSRKFTKRDVTPETVCIVFIASTGELQAKKVIEQYGKITLRSSGGGIKDAFYELEDIEVRSIVIGYQRMLLERAA